MRKESAFSNKKTIAGKLILRVVIAMMLSLIVLFIGIYHTISKIFKEEYDRLSISLLAICGDVIADSAFRDNKNFDNYVDEIVKNAEYVCKYYRADYFYMFIPNEDYTQIKYVAVVLKDKTLQKRVDDIAPYYNGISVDCVLDKDIIDLYEDSSLDRTIHFNNENFNELLNSTYRDTLYRIEGIEGDYAICGLGISVEKISEEIMREFLTIALFLLLGFTLIILIIYFFIKKKVSYPAKEICSNMEAFIAMGKRQNVELNSNGDDEFGMIFDSFKTMCKEIDDYIFNIKSLTSEQERQQAELDIAGNIQKGFLSPEFLSSSEYEIRAMMSPAKDVGGDLYDYFSLDGGKTLLFIADVSGKGIPSALYMSITLILAREYAKLGKSPKEILRNLNEVLSERNPRLLFLTAFVGIFDNQTKTLTYSNAGHNYPYIIKETVTELNGAQNTVLGLYKGEEYVEEKIKLNLGDTLFMYTDGVNEASNIEKKFYGVDRLKLTLKQAENRHDDIVKYVYDSVLDFSKGAEQHDDITMLALTVKETRNLSLRVDNTEFFKIKDLILASDLERSLKLMLCVLCEELFTNICQYQFEDLQKENEIIDFSFERYDRVTLRFKYGGMEYDPRQNVTFAEDYDIDNQVGGLGKLIAFSVADTVDYQYKDGKNYLTITKYVKESKNDDK